MFVKIRRVRVIVLSSDVFEIESNFKSVQLKFFIRTNHLGKKFGKENIGLYREDGVAIIKNKSTRLADKTRKEL